MLSDMVNGLLTMSFSVTDIGNLNFADTDLVGMILGPCFGYVLQGFKMYREQSVAGFSPLICYILLIANILRVMWW